MVNNLIEQLNAVKSLSEPATQHLTSIIKISEKPKGTILLKEGEISDRLFFVIKGLARVYYFEKEVQITSWIVPENQFVFSASSYFLQKPSKETIELLENATIICILKKDLEKMYEIYPEMVYISLKINQKYLLVFEERAKLLRLSADERYIRFLEKFPQIIGRIKVEYLATYLGLSRSCIQGIKTKDYGFNKITPNLLVNNQIEYSHFQ